MNFGYVTVNGVNSNESSQNSYKMTQDSIVSLHIYMLHFNYISYGHFVRKQKDSSQKAGRFL